MSTKTKGKPAGPKLTPKEQKDAKTRQRVGAARDAFLLTGDLNLTIRGRAVATVKDDLDDRLKAAVSAYRAA